MAAPADEPLVYTTRGNLPAASLRLETEWEIVPGQYIECRPVYYLGDEEVRRDRYVAALRPLTSEAVAQPL